MFTPPRLLYKTYTQGLGGHFGSAFKPAAGVCEPRVQGVNQHCRIEGRDILMTCCGYDPPPGDLNIPGEQTD